MKALLVLISTFIISNFLIKLKSGEYDYKFAGRLAMAAMLSFTAIGHFIYTEGMSQMIPDFIPLKTEVVYLTGIVEVIFGIGILIPKSRTILGWGLILFLLMILPANIKASLENINYISGEMNGNGLTYLWFRIPLQLLFIGWTYYSTIKK